MDVAAAVMRRARTFYLLPVQGDSLQRRAAQRGLAPGAFSTAVSASGCGRDDARTCSSRSLSMSSTDENVISREMALHLSSDLGTCAS